MAVIQYQDPAAIATLLSTGLNSLANNTNAAESSAVTNSTGNFTFADFELYVTFASSPTAGNLVLCYFLIQLDGTNYSDGSSSVTPATPADFSFPVRAVATAQRIKAEGIRLPACDFKVLLRNEAGQAFTSSGHTLKYRTYNYETV